MTFKNRGHWGSRGVLASIVGRFWRTLKPPRFLGKSSDKKGGGFSRRPSGKTNLSDCWNIPSNLNRISTSTQSGSIFQPAYVRLPECISNIRFLSILRVQFSTEPLWEKGLVVRNQLLLDPVFEFKNIITSSRRSLGWRSRFPVRVGSGRSGNFTTEQPETRSRILSRRIACGSFMGVFC